MTDLERIQYIQNTFGCKLKKVDSEEIENKEFYSTNIFYYPLRHVLSPSFPFKGARTYCLSNDNNLTGLALDFLPVFFSQMIS